MQEWEVELDKVVHMLKTRLELLQDGGISYLSKVENIITKESLNSSINKIKLDEINKELVGCQRCKLCSGRTNIVFGSGSHDARIVFVGEAPGAEEDKQGLPFVGRAGQLLTKMIEAMGFKREEVYICNVVKCRPEGNRDPEADEIKACEPFLKQQLAAIKPEVVVGLGRYACQTLLATTTSMSSLRGVWHEYDGIKFMPTFHPAYLLRNPPAKKFVWEDLQKVMEFLSLPVVKTNDMASHS